MVTPTPTGSPTLIPVESFQLDKNSLQIYEGESEKLTYSIAPENASDKTVIFSSSDSEIANVGSDGTVEAKTPGECTITATCGGIQSTCKVIVDKLFNHEEAKKSVSHEAFLSEIDENKFILIKAINNYKYPMHLQPLCRFYSEKNELVGNLSASGNYCLKSGGTSYFKVEAPKEFARYEVDFGVQDTNYANTTNVESVEVASYELSEGASVYAVIRNNSNIDARHTYVSCAFYSKGRIVDISYHYVQVRYLGAEESVSFGTSSADKEGIDGCVVNIEYSY